MTILLHIAFSAFSAYSPTKANQWSAARNGRRTEAGQSFGGGKLVTAEETRSGAGGVHAEARHQAR